MARRWPKDLAWSEVVLEVENSQCGECGRQMHLRAHRHRRIFSLEGPLQVICKLRQCVDPTCPNRHRTFSPEREWTLTMP